MTDYPYTIDSTSVGLSLTPANGWITSLTVTTPPAEDGPS